MSASIELDSISVQHTEDTGSALVAAYLPDVIDGVAGIVHVDHGLLPVELQTCLQSPWMGLLAQSYGTSLDTSELHHLRGQSSDGGQHIACRSLLVELATGVYPVLKADEPDAVLLAEIQERSQLPDSSQRMAEPGYHYGVVLLEPGEHLAPFGTQFLLHAVLNDDPLASDSFHPGERLLHAFQNLALEYVSDCCRDRVGILLQRYSFSVT